MTPLASSALIFVTNFVFLLQVTTTEPIDNRCFLEGGGSTENFFVSEALPVGSIIGILRVIGNPGFNGDISLKLATTNPVVAIAPNSKNLTLISLLDKEEINGPSSVSFSIICERRGFSTDPSFTIPVHIRVSDVNDNIPVFLSAPYYLNISESTIVGSLIKQGIKATDADQPGPFSTVQYSIQPGPYSDYFEFTSSSLDGTLVLKKALDYETASNFNITIRASDQGDPSLFSETLLIVTVLDADDQNPIFEQARYFANLPQQPNKGTKLDVRPESLRAFDQDTGIKAVVFYIWHGDGPEYKYFLLDQLSGQVTLTRDIQDNELVQPATLVVKAYQSDNADRYALSTLTVSRGPAFSPILQFLQRVYNAAVLENTPINTVLVSLAVNKPGSENLQFYIDEKDGERTQFNVDQNGEVVLRTPLDFETSESHQFVVWATDGVSNDTAVVNISVLNVNDWDPRFRYASYEFIIADPAAKQGFIVGQVEVADGDKNDRIDLELKGPQARAFSISPDGDIVLNDPLQLNNTEAYFVVTARDSGIPPRQSSVPVKVTFPADFLLLQKQAIPGWSAGSSSTLLMLIFGLILGVLILVISGLAVYVCQYKKSRKIGDASKAAANSLQQSMNGNTGIVATLRRKPINPLAHSSFPRRIVPARTPISPPLTASSALSGTTQTASRQNSSESRETQISEDIGEADRSERTSPGLELITGDEPSVPDGKVSIDRIDSRIPWPQGSIPKRVKKLSWEDEYNVFF